MADLIQINNLVNKYNDNLLLESSTFNNAPTINYAGNGALTIVDDYAVSGNSKSAELYTVQNVIYGIDEAFDFGSALSYDVTKDGNYIFQFAVNPQNVSANPSYTINLQLDVYIDAVLTHSFINALDLTILTEQDFYTFAQSFNLIIGQNVNFKFKILSDSVGTPNPFFTLNFSGFKLEIDDKILNGIPTIYSLPLLTNQDIPTSFVFVSSLSDLPTPITSVITLLDNYTYYIIGEIDLAGNRIVGGANTTILGSSSENSILTSTGLGVGIPLITSIYTTPIRNICIKNVDTAFSFDGTSNPNDMALDWNGVNFVNVPNVGTIKKASNFIFDKGAFINSKGIKFDGTIGTIGLGNSLFSADGLAGDLIKILSTCTVTRRFRIIYSSIVSFGSTVGVNVDVSATIPVESYILDTINFSGGGTYLSGVLVSDNKTKFLNCKGISNTNEVSLYYMHANATTTIISATNTPVKVLGTTTGSAITQKFTNTDNRATYNGSLTRIFKVTACASCTSGNNNIVGFYIAKNGVVTSDSEIYTTTGGTGKSENVSIQTLVSLSENDYIEVWVENNSSITNVLVSDLNVIIE